MESIFWSSLKKTGILKKLFKKPFLNDEPKLFSFGAEIDLEKIVSDGNMSDPYSSGTSINLNIAVSKAIFEAIERFSLSGFKFKNLEFKSYERINKNYSALDPKNFCYFSQKQLRTKKFKNFCFSSKCKFYWTKCLDLNGNQEIYLPAQTIYCPYKYQNGEKVLSFPVTTGASIAKGKSEAIYKGLCEVIERDAYTTNYLLKLSPREVIYTNVRSEKITKLLEVSEKYNLELRSFLLVSDFRIPTILSMIIDKTRKGPALSIGLKTEWNLEKAILGSIEEAFQIRSWIRINMIKNDWTGVTFTTKSMLKRAYLWKNVKSLKNLNFILQTPLKIKVTDQKLNRYSHTPAIKKLFMLEGLLNKRKISAYYKDVTSKKIKGLGIVVVKCVIPNLHPMFIDQDFPYLGGVRIEKLKKRYKTEVLNTYPHPFL